MDRIATVKKTSEILRSFSFSMKKNYGQNFLVVPTVPLDIVNKIDIDKETLVIEIGPGVGALTQCLLEKAKKVICYEIDETLIPILKEVFKEYDSLEVINKDFLKVDLEKEVDLTSYKKVVVASNLPYYITSEILIKLFVMDYPFSIAAMMQKEVAKRIVKSNGGKDENELTLCSKYFTTYKLIKEVSKNDFFPKPNVDSSVLLFNKKDNIKDRQKFVNVIKVLFSQRRKTIYNNLKPLFDDTSEIEKFLNRLNIDKLTRVEDLSFDKIVEIVENI